MRKLVILFVFILTGGAIAQEDIDYPIITSENILQLESVHQLSFETDLFTSTQDQSGENSQLTANIQIGWFVFSSHLRRFLLIDNMNNLYPVFDTGETVFSLDEMNIIDAVSFGDGFFAILSALPTGFSVRYDNLQLQDGTSYIVNVTSSMMPSALWITCSETGLEDEIDCYASVEAFQDDETVILTMQSLNVAIGSSFSIDTSEIELEQRPYLPASDADAVVRIGRIPLPYVVTSSLDGIVKLWNLDTDDIIYEVNNGTGEPSVFGNINADATHLVWRDNANQTLYLLNFETGENREIAPLNGDYAQWYFLTNDASAIIAVNLGGEPNVVVWDTATGERTDLGNYRDCERPQPDMVRLTEDGTTLIIGCDTGLDIWRVNLER